MIASALSQSVRLILTAIFFLALCQHVQADYNVEYCSTLNTADTPKNTSIYQSNSLCYNFCNEDQYAFAIVQYQGCWCSNYAPATNTTGCTMDCPGWTPEKCGNTENGLSLYGYVELPSNPSGTKGASAASSSTSSAQVTVNSTPGTVTASATTTATTSSPSTSSSTSSSTSTQRTTSSSITTSESTWTPTPVTSVETVTGLVRTFTVTPTVPPNSQATNPITKSDKGGGGLSTGGAVGLTIGLVALIAIIGTIAFFCLRKRRNDKQSALENLSRKNSSAGFGAAVVPSRTMSENSRYVLGTDGRRVVENWEPAEDVRRSRLMPVDQRLDPFSPVYQRGGENKSRESVNTIRDDHDYSRRVASGPGILRATNPD